MDEQPAAVEAEGGVAGARRGRSAVGGGEAPAHRGELEQVQLLEGVRGVVTAEDEHTLLGC